jgi:hypothetical protein
MLYYIVFKDQLNNIRFMTSCNTHTDIKGIQYRAIELAEAAAIRFIKHKKKLGYKENFEMLEVKNLQTITV